MVDTKSYDLGGPGPFKRSAATLNVQMTNRQNVVKGGWHFRLHIYKRFMSDIVCEDFFE